MIKNPWGDLYSKLTIDCYITSDHERSMEHLQKIISKRKREKEEEKS